MAGKVFVQGNLGVTQTIDSGKALAHFLGLEEALPQVISLANGARLSLSSKRDCYYFTNSRSCSCRAGLYGKICKHRRSLLEGSFFSPSASSKLEESKASVAQSRAQAREYQARQRQLKAQVKEISSQVMGEEPLVQRGGFKPFLEA
jgi:hypothetical protein